MSDIFLEVLNTSIAASWVVLAVVLARLLLRRAPRSLVCGLWALVGARLVIGRAWEAPFSLIPSAQTIPPESLFDQTPVIDSGVAIIDRVVNPVYTESFRANPVASVNPLQVWMAVWAMIWVLGMVVMVLWALISWLRIRRRVGESIEDGGVFLCDRIDSPFILGILRPKIYLPSDLDEDAKAHVIAHERAHLARRDHWWKPLGYLLLTINWFNPVLWLAYVLLCRDIEMACDERVVRDLLLDEKKAYSAALLRCSISRRTIAACPLAFGEVGVKARIKSVLHYKKPAFWVILVTVVLMIALAAGLLTTPGSGPAEIRYNGVLYIQEGEPVDHIPDKQQSTDSLRSVLHDSTKHPQEDGQAVRLGWEYAGQPMVLVGNALYLEQPGGGSWLPFLQSSPEVKREENRLGIYLSVRDVRPTGLTLICEQDTTPSSLNTDSEFSLAREEEGKWLYLPTPENVVWSSVAKFVQQGRTMCWEIDWTELYGALEPGKYRIYKSFFGGPVPSLDSSTEQESIKQTCCAEFTLRSLGIDLGVEDVTPNGLILVCTQDGTPWKEILTGSPWSLEQWTEEGWVNALPESTVWTMIAYSVPQNEVTRWNLNWSLLRGSLEPGTYRVGKHFTATPVQPPWGGVPGETVEETVYAKFTIE